MAFRLPLAPPETLGRRFQYALLSLKPEAASIVGDDAVFGSKDDYLDLVRRALDAVRQMVVGQRRRGECPQPQVRGVDCCGLHRGPSLYAAGKRATVGGQKLAGDFLLLARAGFTSCRYVAASGKLTLAWNHAAVSYADMVLSRGSPLGGRAEDLPWLAKATVFGKVRVTGRGVEPKGRAFSLDTLGSVLLGGAISFLHSQRLGDSDVEFYLVPDMVHPGFADLRGIMLLRGFANSSVARAARLANDYPVSLEVALALALAEDLASKLGPATQLSAFSAAARLERAALVVTVTPQQRPMVRSVIPLSVAVYAAYSPSTFSAVSAVARLAARAPKQLSGVRDLVGRCISSMYLQAAGYGWSDHLSHCIRDLHTAAYQAERVGLAQLADALRSLADSLSRDYLELRDRVETAVR